MRFLSLFAGIGGFDLGLEQAGHDCAGQVEIDPFCRRVLAARFASVEQQADVRVAAFDDGGGGIDLLCGGFPCQDLSVAGKRGGLKAARSGLFWEIVRIAKIIRPTWGLFENVPGLLSSGRGADMSSVIGGLRECWPVVGWRILDSRHFGVPQRRRRVFFVCGPTEARVRAVLFEPEGGTGDPAAGGETGARVAASLTSGIGAASNDPGRRREDDVNLVVARPLTGTMFKGHDEDTDTLVAQCHGSNVGPMGELRRGNGHLTGGVPFVAAALNPGHEAKHTYPGDGGTMNLVTHALSCEGADASEDGTGRGTPIVTTALRHLGNGGPDDNEAQGGHLVPVLRGFGHGWQGQHNDDVSKAGMVRRLTPLECELLQGFPPGWTCLCQPMSAYRDDPDEAAMRCKCPDSPRYRALGNAVTVNVIRWIGRRIPA